MMTTDELKQKINDMLEPLEGLHGPELKDYIAIMDFLIVEAKYRKTNAEATLMDEERWESTFKKIGE